MAEEAATADSPKPQILEAQNEHDESSKPLDHFEQGGKGADQKVSATVMMIGSERTQIALSVRPKPHGKISTSKLPSPLDRDFQPVHVATAGYFFGH